jgi:hypothetical protein
MLKKIITAFLALAVLAALMPASLADSGDVKPYQGWIGADSPLYKVKVGWQKLDVALTFDNTEKMKKQMSYAEERLSEAQAMAIENNTEALETALDEYVNELDELNETTQAPDINETEYANLSPLLYHHQQCFYGLMNNTSANWTIQGRYMICNQTITKMKNGMPFYYYNGTAYFIPPGQMKKYNSTFVPPGLTKKGYVAPVPTITNGSVTWPWDEINYSYGNKTLPNGKVKNNNGNGNGNGNNKK